jgi:hypothetical protein
MLAAIGIYSLYQKQQAQAAAKLAALTETETTKIKQGPLSLVCGRCYGEPCVPTSL